MTAADAKPEMTAISRIKTFSSTVVLPWWREVRTQEERLFRVFVVVSAVIHLGVVLVQGISLWQKRQQIMEEWTMDADLISDIESGAPKKSALPDAKESPEEKVSDRLLPQLTKKFTIDEKPPEEKTFLEKQEVKPGEKPVKEEIQEARAPTVPKDDDEQNKLQKEEALKRLAIESLRRQEKLDKENKAETKGDPKIADKGQSMKDINTGANVGIPNRSSFNRYRSQIQAAVKRNYSLPEAYNYKSADIKVVMAILLTENGSIADLKVESSSGDQVFDDFALQALKASSPLPPPPRDMVGIWIALHFTPGSF